jgi:hypothetical protein
MMRLFLAAFLLVVACNTASDLRQWYAATETSRRPAKAATDVAVFETAPADRQFTVIGIFGPPANAFESYAEAVNGARRAAALYGADAIVITKGEEIHLSRVNIFEPSTGIVFRAQAIVWR